MREMYAGLTTRGKALLSLSVMIALGSFLVGEKGLFRVAVLLAVLPLLSILVVSRTRYQVSTVRVLDPVRIEAGQSARVTLQLRNMSPVPTGTMMLEDKIPFALGTRPRVVLERLAGGCTSAVSYSVRAEARGLYELGPLRSRLTDPFGLVEVTRSYPSTDELTVTPAIAPLPAIRIPGDYAGTGEHRSRAVAVHGDDDAAVREYRHGDDLRRVHWRATAHSGELMVRREEQPWDSHATVLLDSRAEVFHGEGPANSFEWAVAAAASITSHLRRNGYKTRMVTKDREVEPDTGNDSMLDYLAKVRTTPNSEVSHLVKRTRKRDRGGLFVAIVGPLDSAETEQLATLASSGASCMALLVDSTTWLSLHAAARQQAERAVYETSATLRRCGWRVETVTNGTQLGPLWRSLARDGTSSPSMAQPNSGGQR